MAVKLNKHDLEFVLKQIKIAEAHTAGTPLTDMIVQPHLPYGLRTVDGTYNNILPGRELWGAADQTMPRMFDPYWREDNDGDTHDENTQHAPGGVIDNTDYDSAESVADADPRIISNLIVDQTPNNPAALTAALRHAGHEGDLTEEMALITAPFELLFAVKQLQFKADILEAAVEGAAGRLAGAQATFNTAQANLATAQTAYDTDPNAQTQALRDAAQEAFDTAEARLIGAQTGYDGTYAAHQGVVGALGGATSAAATFQGIGAQAALDAAAAELGIEFEVDGTSLKIPNVAPDEGLSAPFNGWMTFFGQFFDHGLDLVSKGGAGTVYVPLQPDDPLYVEGSPTNFMVLTRATQFDGPGADGVLGTADDTHREGINVTTPFVDQNQTYTSHPSHQVFLREYKLDADGKPLATGRMLDGDGGGLPTWKDVKEHAREMLGIELTDRDVFNIPLIRTDLYGEFIRDPETGFAQVIIGVGPDGIPNTGDDVVKSGTPSAPLKLDPANGGTEPARTSHSFLDDIAHNAVPVLDTTGQLRPDGVGLEVDPAGNAVQFNPITGRNLEYDNELLDRHFITGDGRGNENIGLTAVHHVFHSEHNRQVDAQKLEILKTKDLDFINEWLLTDLTSVDDIPATGEALATYAATLAWDGERIFQAARFATEMQYQHLVFEEFGRKVQPLIDLFVFNTITDIDPAIFAEFAHVVYRFGHSMLTEEISRMFLNEEGAPIRYVGMVDANGDPVLDANGKQIMQIEDVTPADLENWGQDTGLIEAFLNPIEFDKDGTITHEAAAGAIFRGMTRVHGNEIDEFVVDALRTNLLGLPLDLAAINIARGRDTGMPTLNQAREQLYEASNSTFVKPYESWADFASNLKNPASVVNFIAAYGTHDSITSADTVEAKRDAAMALVGLGEPVETEAIVIDNGSFEQPSLAAPGGDVIASPLGNYTVTPPTGWQMSGTGGVFAPVSVVDPSGLDGSNVAWLGQDALLSREITADPLEEGVSYRLTVDIGDRTDTDWPGGVVRLVTADGTELASASLEAPADGGWSTVTLVTPALAAGLVGLRVEIAQAGGSPGQILVDDVRLDMLQPTEFPSDRFDFLNGAGSWANQETGLNLIDLWIGGLAEKKMPFGGMLGSTFNAVFEAQLEMLQDLDRFYYLTRTQGLNLLNELENNAFSKLVMANTDMTLPGPDGVRGTEDDIVNYHVGVDSFAKHDFVLHVDPDKQIGADPTHDDPTMIGLGLTKVIRDNPLTTGVVETNYIRFIGGEHTVLGGTEEADTIIADYGDDAIWGGGGNDRIEGGAGVDLIIGGSGEDIITDSGDTGDFIKGEDGDDVIANANGLDILMGGDGKDVFLVGVDATEVFAGEGDDFVLGGADADFLLGNEGDDWMEGGDGFDVLNGDNSELFFNSTIKGHDVLLAGENENDFDAESGDDIMVQGESVMRNEGMFGFDWAIHKGNRVAADSDMRIPIFTNVADDILRDRFDQTEGLSGWKYNDVLRGDDRGDGEEIEVEFNMTNHELTQAGIDRIDGLRELLGDLVADIPEGFDGDLESLIAYKAGNIIIGGDGSDVIEGRGGDDFIHGDAWLNVRISVKALDAEGNVTDTEAFTVDSLKQVVTVDGQQKPLSEFLLAGQIKPKQLQIVREILYDEDATDNVDTAVFAGNRDWYEITQLDGGIIKVARREMEEIDPQVSEGTDTLVGIERIQFADQIVTIRETGNVDPTGRLTITGMPATEGNPLIVHADNVRDLNNPDGVVTNISYRWQVERNDGTGDYMNIPNVSGDTFTPSDEHVGLRIRVLGTYIDGGGVIETVTSQPTDVVIGLNDEPVGPLLISDMTPTEGQELTATVAFIDPDGTSDAFEELLLTYQWQYSVTASGPWIDVPAEQGGNARSFTPNEEQVGHYVRMVVDYTDDLGFPHQVISEVTGLVGNYLESDAAVIDAGLPDNFSDGTTQGDDHIEGGAGANTISGLAGADILNGGDGVDTLNGGDGADTLNGEAGDDIVNGDGGDDTIIHAIGDDGATVDGGAGLDTLRILDNSASGDANAEITLAGGAITNAAGATMTSVESAQLDLGSGNDTLTYSATTDGGVSVNLLAGLGTGFSFIRGVENVNGGAHADTLLGNGLGNTMTGQDGDDTVRGGFGIDMLEGNAGNDRLYGDEGDDTLNGGDGDDRIDGGDGTDTASYADAASAVNVTLASQEPQDTLGAGVDMLVSIENLIGSADGDTLTGNAGNNVIDGGGGMDIMAGAAGDDTYVVDAGDVVTENANEGNDTVRTALSGYTLAANVENLVLLGGATGGTGNASDNELAGNAEDNILDGGGGTDTVVLDGHITDYEFALDGGNITVTSDAGGTDTLISIERIKVGGVAYNIAAGTNAANNGGGAVTGGAGSDILLGFNGVDELIGNGGDDILIGGTAGDTMVGGGGNDTYIVEQGGDFVSEDGGSGIDTIYSSVTRNLTNVNHVDQDGEIENVTLTGSGNVNAVGNALDNVLTGNSGNNTLNGGGGVDTLIGNAGADDLRGGAADDTLIGGDGDDELNGQGGGGDVAVFAGAASDYTFNTSGAGLASVTHTGGGSGGTDTLTNIERLAFGTDPSMAIMVDAPGVDGTLLATEASIILGGDGNDEIRGSDANDVIVGGAGDDNLFGSDVPEGDNATTGATDDDTFIWNAGDGSDTVHGGFEGLNGDKLVITGNAESETYRIYTVEEATARIGFAEQDAGGDFEPEIVVTRQTAGGDETVIAVLVEIEEIVVNGANVAGNGGAGGDTFEIYGNFDTTTSLRPNTITITGTTGDDQVDISALLSAHRIVFKTKGGNDTIIGTLRPQDVVLLPDGTTIEDYDIVENLNGTTSLHSADHVITFTSSGGMPQFNSGDGDDDDDDDDDHEGNTPPLGSDGDGDDDDDDDHGEDTPATGNEGDGDNEPDVDDGDDDGSCGDDDDDDDDETGNSVTPPTTASAIVGTEQADALTGTADGETIMGLGGRDVIFAGSGDDNVLGGGGADMVYGDAGDDRILAGGGDDLVTGGAGSDTVFGEGGDDIIVAQAGDGDDAYYGDGMSGGAGTDTLDMSAIGSNVTADLGTGFLGHGSASSAASGSDTLWGIENIVTGSGDDTITAGSAVNVMDGGTGNDTFRFLSAADAAGDTIMGFQPGDKIDLSGMDANWCEAGNQSFTLVSDAFTGARGELLVTHENRDGEDYTVVQGNTSGGGDADFKISIKGSHDLTASDFSL